MSQPNEPRRADHQLLAGLLGPAAPELSCEECFEALDRYVELRLAAEPADERVPGMRAHLAGCPACAEEYRSLRDLLSSAGDDGPGSPAP